MFIHCNDFKDTFEEIKRLDEEAGRHYDVNGKPLPSVTTVISHANRKKWAEWRRRVGEEEANRVNRKATKRGTGFHKVAEVYIDNGDYKTLKEWTPLVQLMFQSAKSVMDTRLDTIYCQEVQMYSEKLGVAGTVDLICEFDNELAVVDFKTAKSEKPEEWLEDYFVQLSAYWGMFSEKTGVVPRKLVVFLVGENGDVQIVERRNIMHYLTTLQDYVRNFIQYRDARSQADK